MLVVEIYIVVVAHNILCRGCSQHQLVFTTISTFVVGTHCTHAVHALVFTVFGWFFGGCWVLTAGKVFGLDLPW